jgi:hypothetical protein
MASGIFQTLLLPVAVMVGMEREFDKYQKLYVQSELLIMGGGSSRNV